MKRTSLRYLLLTSRPDQFWFPLAFWLLFIIIALLRGEAYVLDTARAYLAGAVPLVGGILAGYAVLEDPALELRFATPVQALQTLLERLLPIFLIQGICALTFQLFALFMHADFTSLFPDWVSLQLAWLVPTISLMALGCFASIAGAQSIVGALMAGMVWMVELVARGWFAKNAIAKYFLVFMSSLMVDHPALNANRVVLLILSLTFFFASWLLLRRQERYL